MPNVGKSTLFNALTRSHSPAENFPFCTIEPNIGVVAIPDPRLEAIAEVIQPEKLTPAVVQFVDIAGLVRGASTGEGLGNQFLAHIREVDAIVQVVRCFSDSNITHVEGSVDPVRDAKTVELELLLADMATVANRKEKTARMLKTGEERYRREMAWLEELEALLDSGKPARMLRTTSQEHAQWLSQLFLLTAKPVLYAANVDEDWLIADETEPLAPLEELRAYAREQGSEVVTVSARIEAELMEMDPEEAAAFQSELGISELSLGKLVTASYQLLDLLSFYTVKGPETRAWSIKRGTKAPQAAGGRFILIWKRALFGQKWYPTRICSNRAPLPLPGTKVWSDLKVRTTRSPTVMWCCFASMLASNGKIAIASLVRQ